MWTSENRPKYNRDKLRYPSDLTDDEWSHIEPLIPPAKRGGRRAKAESWWRHGRVRRRILGCSSLHFSTEGVIRRDRDERFRTNPARNIFRSADRGFTQRRENAIGAGRRSRGCGLAQHPYRQVDR